MPGFTAIINNAYLFVLPVGILLAPGAAGLADVRALARLLPPVGAFDIERVREDPLRERGRMLAQANIDRIDSVLGIEELSCPEAPKTPEGRLGVPSGRDFLLRGRRGAGVARRLAGNPCRHGMRGRGAERLRANRRWRTSSPASGTSIRARFSSAASTSER